MFYVLLVIHVEANGSGSNHKSITLMMTTIRPTGLSAQGSGFLLRKNGAEQPRLNSVAQLGGPLPRVENDNKY